MDISIYCSLSNGFKAPTPVDVSYYSGPKSYDCIVSCLLQFQGVLMFKDQYRAVMQYSLPRDSGKPGDTGSPRSIHHDWICAKVGLAVLHHPVISAKIY